MTFNVRKYVVLFVNLGGDFLGSLLHDLTKSSLACYISTRKRYHICEKCDGSNQYKVGTLPCLAIRHTRIQHEGFHAQCVYCEGSDKPTRFATKTSLCAPSYTFFEERTLWECHTYSWDARPNKHMIKSYDFSDHGDSEKFGKNATAFSSFRQLAGLLYCACTY